LLVYRVLPHRADAAPGEPGHARFVHPDQGSGRWDNPDLYALLYVAASATGAIGEAFAGLSIWSEAMLGYPTILGSRRRLVAYELDDQRHQLLDFDDAKTLAERGLRPTDIVKRNRARTQAIARDVFAEGSWAGLSWWSMHYPDWRLHALWELGDLEVREISELRAHPALGQAAEILGKQVDIGLA